MYEIYLKNMGALNHISIDFKYKFDSYREGKEEKQSHQKGDLDRHKRNMALLKGIPPRSQLKLF